MFVPPNLANLRKTYTDIANINSQIRSRGIADAGNALRNKKDALEYQKAKYNFDRQQISNNIAQYLQAKGIYDHANPENTERVLRDALEVFAGHADLVYEVANRLQGKYGFGNNTYDMLEGDLSYDEIKNMSTSAGQNAGKELQKSAFPSNPQKENTTESFVNTGSVLTNYPVSNTNVATQTTATQPAQTNTVSTQDNLKNIVNDLLASANPQSSNTALSREQLIQQKAKELARESTKDERTQAYNNFIDKVQKSSNKAEEHINEVNELKNNNLLLKQTPEDLTKQVLETSTKSSQNPLQIPEVTPNRALWDMRVRNDASSIPGEREAADQLIRESRANWNQRQQDAKVRNFNLEDRKRLDNISEAYHYFQNLQNNPEIQDKSKYALTEEYLAKDYPEYANKDALFSDLHEKYQKDYNENLEILRNNNGIFKSELSNNNVNNNPEASNTSVELLEKATNSLNNSEQELTPEAQIYNSIPKQIPLNSYDDMQLMSKDPLRYSSRNYAIKAKNEAENINNTINDLKEQYSFIDEARRNSNLAALGLGNTKITPYNQEEAFKSTIEKQNNISQKINDLEKQYNAKVSEAINAWATYNGIELTPPSEQLMQAAFQQNNTIGSTNNTQQNLVNNSQKGSSNINNNSISNVFNDMVNGNKQYDLGTQERVIDSVHQEASQNLKSQLRGTIDVPTASGETPDSVDSNFIYDLRNNTEQLFEGSGLKSGQVNSLSDVTDAVLKKTVVDQSSIEQTDKNELMSKIRHFKNNYLKGSGVNYAQAAAIMLDSMSDPTFDTFSDFADTNIDLEHAKKLSKVFQAINSSIPSKTKQQFTDYVNTRNYIEKEEQFYTKTKESILNSQQITNKIGKTKQSQFSGSPILYFPELDNLSGELGVNLINYARFINSL